MNQSQTFSAKRVVTSLALMAAAALVLAACGGNSGNGGDGGATAASSSGAGPATVHKVNGRAVLVDAQGRTLYTPDQERSGRILCTGSCTSIWKPAKVSGAPKNPTVKGLGAVRRPDGGMQLTLRRGPLYSFTEERAGQLTGDGFVDSFGGTRFTWRAARAAGTSAPSTPAPSSGGGASGY
jgi:predicted lipoprotein with Yx(FWY)xxD motif